VISTKKRLMFEDFLGIMSHRRKTKDTHVRKCMIWIELVLGVKGRIWKWSSLGVGRVKWSSCIYRDEKWVQVFLPKGTLHTTWLMGLSSIRISSTASFEFLFLIDPQIPLDSWRPNRDTHPSLA
jgi:hypothetical protein